MSKVIGIDLGTSAGGAFSGANLIELMKSRKIVEKALLNPITVNGKTTKYFFKNEKPLSSDFKLYIVK